MCSSTGELSFKIYVRDWLTIEVRIRILDVDLLGGFFGLHVPKNVRVVRFNFVFRKSFVSANTEAPISTRGKAIYTKRTKYSRHVRWSKSCFC